MTNFNCVCPFLCLFISSFVFLYLGMSLIFVLSIFIKTFKFTSPEYVGQDCASSILTCLQNLQQPLTWFEFFSWSVMRDLTNSQDKPTDGCPIKTNIGTKCPIESNRFYQYLQNLSILDHICLRWKHFNSC